MRAQRQNCEPPPPPPPPQKIPQKVNAVKESKRARPDEGDRDTAAGHSRSKRTKRHRRDEVPPVNDPVGGPSGHVPGAPRPHVHAGATTPNPDANIGPRNPVKLEQHVKIVKLGKYVKTTRTDGQLYHYYCIEPMPGEREVQSSNYHGHVKLPAKEGQPPHHGHGPCIEVKWKESQPPNHGHDPNIKVEEVQPRNQGHVPNINVGGVKPRDQGHGSNIKVEEVQSRNQGHGSDIKVEEFQPPEQAPAVPTEPARAPIKLIREQEDLVMMALHNLNIFYTGAAGAGKSAVLNAIVEALREAGKVVHVTASTGIAALNVNGMTIWTYLGIGLSVINKPLSASRRIAQNPRSPALERILNTDVLIIDEISMVSSLVIVLYLFPKQF